MDQDRQIRYLIPPFFFLAALLLGAYVGGIDLSFLLKPDDAKEVFGVLAATAVAVLPLGFLCGTISFVILQIGARLLRKRTHEAVVDEPTLQRIWEHIAAPTEIQDSKLVLFSVATFDHELLQPGIHNWIMRRWNAFNICVSSCVALVLAHIVGLLISIPQKLPWFVFTVLVGSVFVYTAIDAWRNVMEMIRFQSFRPHAKSSARAENPLQTERTAATDEGSDRN